MEPTITDIYAYQILHFLVTQQQYQIVTIKQQREDIWLMNASQEQYPVVLLSSKSNSDTLQNMEYLRQAHRAILDIIQRESKLYIINTSENASPIENEFMTQIILHPQTCSDEQLQLVFPGIKDIPHDVEDRQKEYAQITRSLEEKQMQLMRQQRKTMSFIKRIPKLTGIISIICIAIWLLVNGVSLYLENSTIAAILCGAYYKMNIVSMHEYWRFLTSGFIHVDIFHLLMNLMALANLGIVCEKIFKKSHFLLILILSIVVGNMFVFLMEGNLIGIGLSGGLFGLLGAFIVTLFENGSIKHPMVKATVMRLLVINLLISILPGISFYAHLGGFICGVFLGFILTPSEKWNSFRKHMTISFVILLGAMSGLSARINVVDPIDKKLDRHLLETVRNLGVDWYADYMQSGYLRFHTEEDLGL